MSSYICLNSLYYRYEGFGTLMGHYAAMYCLHLDCGLLPIIPKMSEGFVKDSAMKFFNQHKNSIDHNECFVNFKNIFRIIDEYEYKNIDWSPINFSNSNYDSIIEYIKKNNSLNLNLYWSLHQDLYMYHIYDIANYLYIFQPNLIQQCLNKLPKTDKKIIGVSVRNEYKRLSGPHTQLSLNYYTEAMNKFDIKTSKFLIFSDFIDETKILLKDLESIYDIEYTESMPSANGMCLLSMCDHIINANSSFSYWASLLNKNPNKKIICPAKFIDANKNVSLANLINYKWYPNTWLGLSCV